MGITIETIARPDAQIVKDLGQFPTAILSDAMEKSQTMHSEIKPVFPIERVCGTAVTARSITADFLTPVAAIDYTQPGDFIVVDVRGYKDKKGTRPAGPAPQNWTTNAKVLDRCFLKFNLANRHI